MEDLEGWLDLLDNLGVKEYFDLDLDLDHQEIWKGDLDLSWKVKGQGKIDHLGKWAYCKA